LELKNNTIALNHADPYEGESYGGGMYIFPDPPSSTVSGDNNIVYLNTSNVDPECFGNAFLSYSCVSTGMSGEGNIVNDPEFLNAVNGDFSLQEYSPCIDTGNPISPLDPDSTRADMGALYYHQYSGIHPEPKQETPSEYVLLSNYPNPFNSETRLTYSHPNAGHVKLSIFNITGRQVDTIVDGWVTEGTHRYGWDASELPTGVYVARLAANGELRTQKLLLIK
jgi:hypothetical protein